MRWWLWALALGSFAGCVAAPTLGVTGWVLFACLYMVARRTEELEERVSELEDDDA